MWSDNDIDNAFRRLDPVEPEPTPFPLDAWLKLEAGLDQAVIDRAVRRRLWQFFAAEVAVVALVGLGWSLWPASGPATARSKAATVATTSPTGQAANAKRLHSAFSVPTEVASPAAKSAANALPAIMPHLASKSGVATIATGAAPASAASAVRGVVGSSSHLPQAVAMAPAPRLHLANGRLAVLGDRATRRMVAVSGRPIHGDAASAVAAGRNAGAASRAETALGASAGNSTKAAAQADNSIGTAATRSAAGSPMAAPARATSEVAIAGAASPNGGSRGAVPSGVLGPDAQSGAASGNASSGSTAAVLAATDASLAPAATNAVALAQPATTALPAQLATVQATAEPLPAAVHLPRFYVGVVAAPDVSTVKFADVESPHLNIGLTLDYRIGQRLRLSTGILRSTKTYAARRDDYDWGAYQDRVYAHDFQNVDGSCTVLDIPLNLRYDLLVRPTYRLTGSAGLSSFFMQRENYYYDWTDATGIHTWNGGAENQNRHLLSILNLSAGAEYGLSSRWSLQAEPYVKVPLAGVGLGKVKLLSAGVYFGVKYGF